LQINQAKGQEAEMLATYRLLGHRLGTDFVSELSDGFRPL
jgi:hypothetical protein